MVGESSVRRGDSATLLLRCGGCRGSSSGCTVVQMIIGVVLETTESVDREMGAGGFVYAGGPRTVVRSGAKV